MTILKHELRQGKVSLIIWASIIAFLMALCILIYPQMNEQMNQISVLFAAMGKFTKAFGMDKLNFGEFIGYFCIECGNVLGLGGAFYAAQLGISCLAKEEKEHTAEFLLTHPISRTQIMTEKLCATVVQITLLNLFVVAISAISMLAVRIPFDFETLPLIILAFFVMQLEIAIITFGISAFIRGNVMPIGMGLAALFYFFNILANMSDDLKFLKYLTPFSYTEGADLISRHAIPMDYLCIGITASLIIVIAAYWKYPKKDIA